MKVKYSEDYTRQEMMVVAAAREIEDDDVIFVGIGLPVLAALLAQRTHAPNLTQIYEAGVIGARPARLALSIGDPALVSGSQMVVAFSDIFNNFLQNGLVDVGFISGAQIDKYGNLNSTVIGDYLNPKVRLPGSGGACAIAGLSKKTIMIMPHEKRRFVNKIDFLTSPGFLTGEKGREEAGLRGGGPQAVISTLGVMRFDEKTKEMYLDSYHPGVSVQDIKNNTSWDIKISKKPRETMPPTVEEIKLLREVLDPRGLYLKR